MSLHPHSSSKLLSTFSSASSTSSSDHHKLSRGSCTGLFFQFFDWNCRLQKGKLFRHKSLPAERPARAAPKDHVLGNEKPHTAQMLNIANGGSSPHDLGCKTEDALQRDHTPEKKRKKRSPNVVAKLMGLETMPSPNLHREKWTIQDQQSVSSRNFEGLSSVSNTRMPSSRRNLMEMENFSLRRDFSTVASSHNPRIRCDLSVVHNMPCEAMTHNNQACKDFTMVAAPLPSHEKKGTFGCVLSPSSTHNKMFLLVKSPMASKAPVRMFEAADRMLEPSRKPRNVLIRSQASRQVLPAGNSEKQNGKKDNNEKATERTLINSKSSSCLYIDNAAFHCAPKKDRRINNAGSFPAASRLHSTSNRQRISSSAADENITEDAAVQQLKRGQGIVNENNHSVKRNRSRQGAEISMDEKEKPPSKRQQRNSRLLRERSSMKAQNTSSMKAKLERDSSPHKCNLTLENRDGSHGTPSTRSTLSTIAQSKSVCSSNSTSKKKRLLSSGNVKGAKEIRVKSDKAETRLDSMPAVKSLSTRRVGTMGTEGPISRKKSTFSKHEDVDTKSSSKPEDALDNAYISKDSILESGYVVEGFDDEVLNDPLSEASCSRIQYSDDVVDAMVLPESMHEGDTLNIGDVGEDWELSASAEIISTHVDSVDISSDLSIAQNARRRSGIFSINEVRDNASSGDINSTYRRKQTISYSGKSTATILQELVSALNLSSKLSIMKPKRYRGVLKSLK